jgi:Na+-translocating ferredoxin:NAD+ oxidoreductase subunit D
MITRSDLITSPHRHNGSTVFSIMFKVCLALIPGIAFYVWYFGPGVLIQATLAIIFALIIELILLKIRKQKLSLYLKDGSVIVTALIFALMITPYTPWWISFIGISFSLVFAKHIYGGLGQNLFNPAAAGYIFVLLCFPVFMNNWPLANVISADTGSSANSLRYIFSNPALSSPSSTTQEDIRINSDKLDSISGATPLADMQNRISSMAMVSEILDSPLYGSIAGKAWEWVNFGYLLGGVSLILLGIISWQIPVAVLGSIFIISLVFNMYDPEIYASSLFHLFSGGSMLGAFFVATDPSTASSTPKGRLIFGCIIGVLAYVIRIWGAYPDGIAFAVLIANSFVPLIDKLTRPKVIGEN